MSEHAANACEGRKCASKDESPGREIAPTFETFALARSRRETFALAQVSTPAQNPGQQLRANIRHQGSRQSWLGVTTDLLVRIGCEQRNEASRAREGAQLGESRSLLKSENCAPLAAHA